MPDLILIHGAWAGAWVWESLRPGLEAAGHRVHALDLPGNGNDALAAGSVSLELYVQAVLDVIRGLPGPVGLVAHSGGGVTATGVAERVPERIAGVAFVAGMMLPPDTPFAEITAAIKKEYPEASGIVPFLETDEAGTVTRVPAQAARRIFFQRAAPDAAAGAAARLTAQPERARAGTTHWTAERFGTVPRLYVEALHDRSLILPVQRRMQMLVPGADVVSLDSDHAPQLSAPDALLDALLSFFAAHAGAIRRASGAGTNND